jgi:phosphoglycolate phosphatase-like HAD superfamily hydrolase
MDLKNISFNIALILFGALFTILGLSGGFTLGNNSFLMQDILARIVSSVVGVGCVVVAIYLEKQKLIASKPTTEKTSPEERNPSSLDTSRDSHFPNVKFVKISEQEFLEGIDLAKVKRLSILGHTGRRIYDEVHEQLDRLIRNKKFFQGEIRILTRTPLVEGLYRNNAIHRTLTQIRTFKLKGGKIDIRFYESVPALRGIICEFHTNNRISYITSYYWPVPNHSKAFDFAHVISDSSASQRPETNLLESWIEQYWGKDEIHTVVFDFDDTLVSTGEIQVKAWAQVIDEILSLGVLKRENLSSKLQNFVNETGTVINKPALLETVRAIFTDKQLAEAIVQDLFVDVNDEIIKQINKKRFEIRENMMDQARLFDGVEKLLGKLHTHYNFAIISSTDEEMISKYLAKKGLLEYFPIILGKKDPSLRFERENIHQKTSLLIKLSEIIGIPLSRLVYIGDNNSDYLATRQLRIAFIEARQAAKLMGKESFVGDLDPNKPPSGHFESFEGDRLPLLLSEHSQNIAESKYQV